MSKGITEGEIHLFAGKIGVGRALASRLTRVYQYSERDVEDELPDPVDDFIWTDDRPPLHRGVKRFVR